MLHWLTTFLIWKVIKIAPLVQKLELHWEGSTRGMQSRLVHVLSNILSLRTVAPSQNGDVYNVYTVH